MSAVDLYTLPDGWLACDACGRPIHHSGLDAHVGSVACQHEQHAGQPPPGWVAVNQLGIGEYTVQFLAELKAPLFKRHDSEGRMFEVYTPPWVHILASVRCDSVARAEAIKRARLSPEYRAVVLAGLRLVNADDRDAVLSVLDIGERHAL